MTIQDLVRAERVVDRDGANAIEVIAGDGLGDGWMIVRGRDFGRDRGQCYSYSPLSRRGRRETLVGAVQWVQPKTGKTEGVDLSPVGVVACAVHGVREGSCRRECSVA